MKQCVRCGERHPLENFNVARTNRDGLSSWCRACFSAYNRAKTDAQRVARVAANAASGRSCADCGDPIPSDRRADATCCSEACMRRVIGRRWARNAAPAQKAALIASKALLPRSCETCGVELTPDRRADARCCSDRCATKLWNKEHPEAAVTHYARRRTRFTGAHIEDVVRLVVLERDDGVCGICGEDVDPFDFHVDHVVPLARGGEHSYANAQVAHPFCNLSKNDSLPWEMAG